MWTTFSPFSISPLATWFTRAQNNWAAFWFCGLLVVANIRCSLGGLHDHAEVVAHHVDAVEAIDRELLGESLALIAHDHADAEVAQLGILGNCAGAGDGLRQAPDDQAQAIAGEHDVL